MTNGREDRARDATGRPLSDRPRDALGRPLPPDAPEDAAVPREDESVVRTPAETIARARELLDAGLPFNAHDVFEAAWKNGPDSERDLWQGLAQLCVAMTHVQRGNPVGAQALFARGAERLRRYGVTNLDPHRLDLAALTRWAELAAEVTDDAALPRTGLPLSR